MIFEQSGCFDPDQNEFIGDMEVCEQMELEWNESTTTCENVNIYIAAEPWLYCPNPFREWFESVCCDEAPVIEPCNKFHFSNTFETQHALTIVFPKMPFVVFFW